METIGDELHSTPLQSRFKDLIQSFESQLKRQQNIKEQKPIKIQKKINTALIKSTLTLVTIIFIFIDLKS